MSRPDTRPLFVVMAREFARYHNCKKRMDENRKMTSDKNYDNAVTNMYDAKRRLEQLAEKYMPSGSGFDSGTQFDIHAGTYKNLRFVTSFHHMNEGGYDGWTEHVVTVEPSLAYGFELKISGRNRNDIKEMMYDTFQAILEQPVAEWEFSSFHKEPTNAEASG